jgi:glycosyltransferase involved in cell wall biosynthesis
MTSMIDDEKISLHKGDSVVFLGSMNAMPMMYAMELKNYGCEVLYFVDSPMENRLSRPENHFPNISYPYPSWIVERVILSQILLLMFPRLFAKFYMWKISRLTDKKIACFVLNGFFSALAPYLPRNAKIISLSHGSDLDVWANIDGVKGLADSFSGRSIFKFIPRFVSRRMIARLVFKQFSGYANSNAVFYFPLGFNPSGDKVVKDLKARGVRYVPRYDISFYPLQECSREFKSPSKELVIFSGVRFLYKTFPDGNHGYNKGNDIIINGIAKYHRVNKNIRVHFVEKGEDVNYAKDLCHSLGLDDVVIWHKEMSFKDLLALYLEADVCFDQVGDNWIAAIGGYALWLGKPLIANPLHAINSEIWPEENPVCSAASCDEVFEWLVKLEDITLRQEVSNRSKVFVERYMSPKYALNEAFNFDKV